MKIKLKPKPETSNEELFPELPEPSRSIAIRAWKHKTKCLQIEKEFGKEEAKKYHELHRFDGIYRSEEEKNKSMS